MTGQLGPRLGDALPVAVASDLDDDGVPVAMRKFGPAFSRKCQTADTIICMSPLCQRLNCCRMRLV